MNLRRPTFGLCLMVASALAACSESSDEPAVSGSGGNSGGNGAAGAAASGSAGASGAPSAGNSSTGGTSGSAASGGTSGSGTSNASGGTGSSAGGSNGGGSNGGVAAAGTSGAGGSAGSASAGSSSGGSAGVTGGAGGGSGGAAGAGGSGGSAGSGGAGGGGDTCKTAGLYVCEDFESATTGSNTVPGWTTTDSVQVVSDQVHGGARSLKVGPKLVGERSIRRTKALSGGSIPGTHWGRVFYRVQTPFPVPKDFVHLVMVWSEGDAPAGRVQMRVFDTIMQSTSLHKFGYNVQHIYDRNEHGVFTNPDYRFESAWKCAEWQTSFTQQSYHFYVGGQEIKAIGFANAKAYVDGGDPQIPNTLASVSIGLNNFQESTAPGFSVWFDDFALGPNRIGCD